MDFDPYGIDILSTYKYGSLSLAHENSHLAVPSMRWLGMHQMDIHNGTIMHMTARDRGKARKMLNRNVSHENGEAIDTAIAKIKRELQCMLFTGFKAEIQNTNGDEESGVLNGFEGFIKTKILEF
jgi:meiotic recombination protein SPO11